MKKYKKKNDEIVKRTKMTLIQRKTNKQRLFEKYQSNVLKNLNENIFNSYMKNQKTNDQKNLKYNILYFSPSNHSIKMNFSDVTLSIMKIKQMLQNDNNQKMLKNVNFVSQK